MAIALYARKSVEREFWMKAMLADSILRFVRGIIWGLRVRSL
jgi:hypothetical protein